MAVTQTSRRWLLPSGVALAVLVGQPLATFGVMQATAHRPDPVWLAPVWSLLFLPSTIFDFFVRATTGQSSLQFFGPFIADVFLGFGVNAVVWSLIAALASLAIQQHLTRRCS